MRLRNFLKNSPVLYLDDADFMIRNKSARTNDALTGLLPSRSPPITQTGHF